MKHDELLAKINSASDILLSVELVRQMQQALHAVIELHHPKDTRLGYHICAAEKDNWAWKHCETIAVIRKAMQ